MDLVDFISPTELRINLTRYITNIGNTYIDCASPTSNNPVHGGFQSRHPVQEAVLGVKEIPKNQKSNK